MTRSEFDKLVTEWMEAFTETERLFAVADKKRAERERAKEEYEIAESRVNLAFAESQRKEEIVKQAIRDGVE